MLLADSETVNALEDLFVQDWLGKPYDLKTLLTQSRFSRLTISPFARPALEGLIALRKNFNST